MNYTEIFDEVVSIMREDSSTCNDLGAGDFQRYKEQIKDDMPAADFAKTVKKYIAIDNPAISLFLKQGFYEDYRTNEKIVLKKDL